MRQGAITIKIIFSTPLELGRVGAGRPYGHLVDWLEGQEKHQVKVIRGAEIARSFYPDGIPPGPESLGQSILADIVASFEEVEGCDVFLGTGCASLDQIRAFRLSPDIPKVPKIVTTWFSSHYRYAYEVLSREYDLVGIKSAAPIDPFLIWRDEIEHTWSNALIVPSQACADTYEANETCKGKTRVANFGVDSEVFSPNPRFQGDFRVLFDGGNWVRKGLHYLISAWNKVQLPGVMTVLGTSPEVARGGWRSVYPGWVPDDQVPGYFSSHSVFCLPTMEEGQALVCLEAMASGMAVITTKESGAPIEHEKNGLIVPSRDTKAIAEALVRLYKSPGEREAFGKAARETAVHYTWKRFGKEVVRILEEVVAQEAVS